MWCQEDHLQGNEFAVSCSIAMVNRHACRGLKSSKGLAELRRYRGKMSLKLQAHCHVGGRCCSKTLFKGSVFSMLLKMCSWKQGFVPKWESRHTKHFIYSCKCLYKNANVVPMAIASILGYSIAYKRHTDEFSVNFLKILEQLLALMYKVTF